jgi:hypothetical protein
VVDHEVHEVDFLVLHVGFDPLVEIEEFTIACVECDFNIHIEVA